MNREHCPFKMFLFNYLKVAKNISDVRYSFNIIELIAPSGKCFNCSHLLE